VIIWVDAQLSAALQLLEAGETLVEITEEPPIGA
jgi:hypothetical protein